MADHIHKALLDVGKSAANARTDGMAATLKEIAEK